ncbi:P27 family phage terminase small subunit [Acetoanaerobium noterae]|uniref:P27 family phage terminase small subunit n=1 Tax=Acetoanaerobium noterae TaxID=745369 RepID=UPI003242E7EB
MARKKAQTCNNDVKETKEEWLQIEEDLLRQIEEKGLLQQHYRSLVADYIAFWQTKNMLIADIRDRGVSVGWDNGGGQTGVKKNDSVAEVVKVSGQMLKILQELGLRGADVKPVEKAVKI